MRSAPCTAVLDSVSPCFSVVVAMESFCIDDDTSTSVAVAMLAACRVLTLVHCSQRCLAKFRMDIFLMYPSGKSRTRKIRVLIES